MMSTVNIVCGDFHPGATIYDGHSLMLQPLETQKPPLKIACSSLRDILCLSCEENTPLATALLWGSVGLLILGPLGAVLGVTLCSKRNEVTFKARLRDGRAFVAIASDRTFRRMCGSPADTATTRLPA
jgi:hypothetical protein